MGQGLGSPASGPWALEELRLAPEWRTVIGMAVWVAGALAGVQSQARHGHDVGAGMESGTQTCELHQPELG